MARDRNRLKRREHNFLEELGKISVAGAGWEVCLNKTTQDLQHVFKSRRIYILEKLLRP